jgi:diguanylate cyclase (GGDEF)-like protein
MTIRTIIKISDCDSVSLFLLNENPENILYSYNKKEDIISKKRNSKRLISEISEKVIRDREIHMFEDFEGILSINPDIKTKQKGSVAAYPIIVGKEIEGILFIIFSNPKFPENFFEDSSSWINLITTISATAIFDARLYNKLDKALKNLRVSFEMSHTLISAFDLDQLLEKICKEIHNRFGYELIALFIREDEGDYITLKYTLDAMKEFLGLKLNIGGEGIVGMVALSGEPYYASDVSKDQYYSISLPEVKSEFAIPLKIGDKVIGVLDIESFRLNDFKEDVRNLLLSIGTHIAIALEKARLYEKTKKLSGEDPLTGILNRRSLEESVNREIERSKRYNTKFSILFFDLDNFKRFNDKYGHSKGDELLMSFSGIIKTLLRKGDLFARYGGDEFIALLYQTNTENAKDVAKRMLKIVNNNEELLGLTFSVGISGFPENGSNFKELVNSADRACYSAKEKGGDRLVVSVK